MSNQPFEITPYTTGPRKNVNYEEMWTTYKLTSEQVREIAIARAKARMSKDEELITIRESTTEELQRTRETLQYAPLDENNPQRIILNDGFLSSEETQIIGYNHQQMQSFKKSSPTLFTENILIEPSTNNQSVIFKKFKQFYYSDIYDIRTIQIMKDIQKILKIEWTDRPGEFWPKTQKKLVEALMKTENITVPSTTPAPSNDRLSEEQARSTILERLGKSRVQFWDQQFSLNPSQIQISKKWENYIFSSPASGFNWIKTPIEVNEKWDIITKTVVLNKPSNMLIWPRSGNYTIIQIENNISITRQSYMQA